MSRVLCYCVCCLIIPLFRGTIICCCFMYVILCICRLISFVEFQAFESLLCAPDAISQLSFKLFDINKSGKVSYGKNYVL